MLSGSVAGMWGGVAFFAAVALLVMSEPAVVTYLVAALAATMVATVTGRLAARSGRRENAARADVTA